MKILLLSTSFNSFTQRAFAELIAAEHDVTVELTSSPAVMREAVALFKPDVILCPFLQAVPDDIWRTCLTIIMHPGAAGDNGPSSIDWAIMEGWSHLSMTALEAGAAMDGGGVWSTHHFKLPLATKSFIYRAHIVEAGAKSVFTLLDKLSSLHALAAKAGKPRAIRGRGAPTACIAAKRSIAIAKAHFSVESAAFLPDPLNAADPRFAGEPRPLMRQADRQINWETDKTEMVVRKIHAADGFPGVLDRICDLDYLIFGAHFEDVLGGESTASPGEIIATRHGAICRKTVDGAVWISHLKRKGEGAKFFKLPASIALPVEALSSVAESALPVLFNGERRTFKEIWYKEKNGVGYLFWEFHNGAMSTLQCRRLEAAIHAARQRPTKVLVFMGGESFWSNGVHLNMIEAAPDPAIESWHNVNAMDDVVLAMLTVQDRLTVAAVRANAAAGGAMLALAADRVIIHDGVVLNPHYKLMGLRGSEYWTYSLPKRIGLEKAVELTNACLPISAEVAAEIGMIDIVVSCDVNAFQTMVIASAEALANNIDYAELLAKKQVLRARDEAKKPLSLYRHEELSEMGLNLWSTESDYHLARRNFVHKIPCAKTPLRLAKHRQVSGGPIPIACG